jgi:hypothetical protein
VKHPSFLAAAVLYAALTLLFTYPLPLVVGTSLVGSDADLDLFMWTLAWDAHAFVRQPLAIFDANIYYPFRHTLAFSENLIGSALVAAPALWTTGNPVLGLNVATLVSIWLCGVGAYVLGRSLGLTPAGAFLCGLVYAFAPARFLRISQLHLTAVQWIPFTLAFLHWYLERRRRRDLRLAAACFTLQALASGHGAVYCAIAAGGLLAYRLTVVDRLDLRGRLRDLGVAGVALLAPAALIVLPYRAVQVEMGLRRTLGDQAPSAVSFLASPTHVQTFLLSFFPGAQVMERASAILFPGFLTVVLAAAAWWGPAPSARLRHDRIFYSVLTLAAVVLAAGLVWPYVYWLPGLNFIRVPSRFMILAMMGLAVLAGLGADRLCAAIAPARRWIASGLTVLLLLVEFAAMPFAPVPHDIRLPAADRWLNGQPKPFVVAEVPVVLLDRYQTAYMLHATAHWQKTVHGYSGFRAPLHETLYRQLTRFPDDESLRALRDLGVTYVVVHADQYHEPGEWAAVAARLDAYQSELTLEYRDPTSRVYALRR